MNNLDNGQIGAATFSPNFAYRMWRALGFRYSAHASRPDADDAIYSVHRVVTRWDLLDRLRILISGTSEVELCVETEAPEKHKCTRSHAAVLAPGAFKVP